MDTVWHTLSVFLAPTFLQQPPPPTHTHTYVQDISLNSLWGGCDEVESGESFFPFVSLLIVWKQLPFTENKSEA